MPEMNYAERDLALLTDHERAGWRAYARQCADLMKLRDWDVHIASGPADDAFLAQERCTFGRRSIVLFLSDRFTRLTPQEQRNTIVHELTHAITKPVEYLVYANCENDTKERYQLFHQLHKEAMEQVVAHFSAAIAEYLPLPAPYAKYVEHFTPVITPDLVKVS